MKNIGLGKMLGFSIVVIMVTGLTTHPAFASTPITGVDLFYTTFSGGTNVHKVHVTWDGVATLTYSSNIGLTAVPGADGINFVQVGPNNFLFIGGQGTHANVIKPDGTFVASPSSPTNCFHTMLIGADEWCSSIPGTPAKFVSPYTGAGTALPLSGTDTLVDTIIRTPVGDFYTSSSASGFGTFGTINLITGATVRLQGPMNGPHGGLYDSFTKNIILCGDDRVIQIDPASPTVIKSTFIGGPQFDQCAADGNGHLFVANNNGNILFMDYTSSKLVGSPDFTNTQFLAGSLDDIAPLSGAGAQTLPVGGEIIPVDMTSLFVAGIMTNAFWMVPTIGGIAGAAIALFNVRKRGRTSGNFLSY